MRKPSSLKTSFVSTVTGAAFFLTAGFTQCDASCQSDFADVKKAVDDVIRARRRQEEEDLDEDSNSDLEGSQNKLIVLPNGVVVHFSFTEIVP